MSEEAKFRCFYFGTKLGSHAQDFIEYVLHLAFIQKVTEIEIAFLNSLVEEIKDNLNKASQQGCIDPKDKVFVENQIDLAASALRRGDWSKAQDFIADIRDLFVGKVKRYVPIY